MIIVNIIIIIRCNESMKITIINEITISDWNSENATAKALWSFFFFITNVMLNK